MTIKSPIKRTTICKCKSYRKLAPFNEFAMLVIIRERTHEYGAKEHCHDTGELYFH